MKYLKIEHNQGYFYRTKDSVDSWIKIDQINKSDLGELLNAAIENPFEMDPYNSDNLANKAHQIVYKNLHDRFVELLSNKTQFKDECDARYKEALSKYSKDSQ